MAREDDVDGLRPDQPFVDAGRVIISSRFDTMWAYREGTLAGDVDALHDMRVGSRRLRAALDVFATAFHGREYRGLHRLTARLTDELGQVRDHDVMLLQMKQQRKRTPRDERAGIDSLVEAITVEREVARRQMRRFFDLLDDEDYASRMRRLFNAGHRLAAAGPQPMAQLTADS